jgi:hypothetical protein
MFKRLSKNQRACLAAVRRLGEVMISPNDARSFKALQRRGLIRYRRIAGARVAVLRAAFETPEHRKLRRVPVKLAPKIDYLWQQHAKRKGKL